MKESSARVATAAWSRDGEELLALGEDGVLRVRGVESGRQRRTSRPGTTAGRFSPDATRLASGGAPWTLRLWDAATGRPLGAAALLN